MANIPNPGGGPAANGKAPTFFYPSSDEEFDGDAVDDKTHAPMLSTSKQPTGGEPSVPRKIPSLGHSHSEDETDDMLEEAIWGPLPSLKRGKSTKVGLDPASLVPASLGRGEEIISKTGSSHEENEGAGFLSSVEVGKEDVPVNPVNPDRENKSLTRMGSSNEKTEGASLPAPVNIKEEDESDAPLKHASPSRPTAFVYLSSSEEEPEEPGPVESDNDNVSSLADPGKGSVLAPAASRGDTTKGLDPLVAAKTDHKPDEIANQKIELGDAVKHTLPKNPGQGSDLTPASRKDAVKDSKHQATIIDHESAETTEKTGTDDASSSNIESEYWRLFPHGTKNPPKPGVDQTSECTRDVVFVLEGLDCDNLPDLDRSRCRVAKTTNFCAHCASECVSTRYYKGDLPCI